MALTLKVALPEVLGLLIAVLQTRSIVSCASVRTVLGALLPVDDNHLPRESRPAGVTCLVARVASWPVFPREIRSILGPCPGLL
jgi:hypothetical protein